MRFQQGEGDGVSTKLGVGIYLLGHKEHLDWLIIDSNAAQMHKKLMRMEVYTYSNVNVNSQAGNI